MHHSVDPNAILIKAGIPASEATALAESGAAYIYETHRTPQLTARIRAAFAGNPATDSVPSDEEITAQGWPTRPENATAFDVLAYAKEDWEFGGKAVQEHRSNSRIAEPQTGAHGYPNTRPLMQEIFIASGAAVRAAGEQLPFPNLDVAATIAQILALPQTGMDGKPLTAILK